MHEAHLAPRFKQIFDMSKARLSIRLLSLLFIAAGVNHFVSPGYLKIMPGYLPWPLALVYVSGFFEVVGGVGLAVQRLRRAAEGIDRTARCCIPSER